MRHDMLFMAHVNHMLFFMARPYIRPGSKIATSKSWKNSGLADGIVVTRCARYEQGRRDEQGLQSTYSWRMTQQQKRIMTQQNRIMTPQNRIMAAAWMEGVKTCMRRQRAFEAVKGKALWVMSASNRGLVRMKENRRSRRDDVTLWCNGVWVRQRKWRKQPVIKVYNNVELIYYI